MSSSYRPGSHRSRRRYILIVIAPDVHQRKSIVTGAFWLDRKTDASQLTLIEWIIIMVINLRKYGAS